MYPPYSIHYYFPFCHPSTFFGPLISKRAQVYFYMVNFKLNKSCTQGDNTIDYTIEEVATRLSSFDDLLDHHHRISIYNNFGDGLILSDAQTLE
jgi:hypothetical protein